MKHIGLYIGLLERIYNPLRYMPLAIVTKLTSRPVSRQTYHHVNQYSDKTVQEAYLLLFNNIRRSYSQILAFLKVIMDPTYISCIKNAQDTSSLMWPKSENVAPEF